MVDTPSKDEQSSKPGDNEAPLDSLKFFKGGTNVLDDHKNDPLNYVQKELTKAMSAKNLAFLLGAGCSSYLVADEKDADEKDADEKEKGIPTMKHLAEGFIEQKSGELQDGDPFKKIAECGINLEDYKKNLEDLLQVLHSLLFVIKKVQGKKGDAAQNAINEVVDYLLEKMQPVQKDEVTDLYKSFYKRIFLREKNLPRPWVFTTNYDLFNEYALDDLGIPYCNGFSGGLTRQFNPATFKLILAQELDVSANRWRAVDNFIYLCKLHGSINWFFDEDSNNLWPIKEMVAAPQDSKNRLMIYPTPAKEGQILGSPYSDLFREFQGRIVREQSVLLVMGYSFSDEHINNIIYQALTIPSFRLVVFTNPGSEGEIEKLRKLNDPRIWIIGGKCGVHFFKNIVDNLLPAPPEENIEDAIGKLQEILQCPKEV